MALNLGIRRSTCDSNPPDTSTGVHPHGGLLVRTELLQRLPNDRRGRSRCMPSGYCSCKNKVGTTWLFQEQVSPAFSS